MIIKTKDGRYWDVSGQSNYVHACPHGGGFVCTIPMDDIAEWDTKLPAGSAKLMTVGFDNQPVCQAWVGLNRWNGWLQPRVERPELEKFMAYQQQLAKDCSDVATAKLEGETLVVTYPKDWEYEPERIEPETLNGMQVWNIGLGFTWEETQTELP